MAKQTQPVIASPCVKNCCLNEQDVCVGCFRSLAEICQWAQANSKRRLQILDNAERRRLRDAHRNPPDAN